MDQHQLSERRHLLQGFGNGLTQAFEIALIPVFFGLVGYLVDRWLGTVVVFAVLFALIGLFGVGIKLWYGYEHRMQALEAEGSWRMPTLARSTAKPDDECGTGDTAGPAAPDAPSADAPTGPASRAARNADASAGQGSLA